MKKYAPVLFIVLFVAGIIAISIVAYRRFCCTAPPALVSALRSRNGEFRQYVRADQERPNVYIIDAVFSGDYGENRPLVDGSGVRVGEAYLLAKLYILDRRLNGREIFVPMVVGNDHGAFAVTGNALPFSSEKEARTAWTQMVEQTVTGGFRRGSVLIISVTDAPDIDTGPGDPRYDMGLFGYWRGRGQVLRDFLLDGNPRDLLFLPTNITFQKDKFITLP